mmetsp:Transcript_119196/g.344793  ORF Transcript_119196/g.344793 Transcript_119196/m.344793 type:complete len:228 (+) Transcript_119196:384-1067(+)
MRDLLLGDALQVHHRTWLKRRLRDPPSASTQRHDALRFEQLEALTKVVDVVALAACDGDDFPEVCVGLVPYENGVNDGADAVHCLQCCNGRGACVVLAVGEHKHAEVRPRVLIEAVLQHGGSLHDRRIDRGLATLRHVVDNSLEAVQLRGQIQQAFHDVVELDEAHLVTAGAHALGPVSKSVEHGLHRLHAGSLKPRTLHNIEHHLGEGRAHGAGPVDANSDAFLHS